MENILRINLTEREGEEKWVVDFRSFCIERNGALINYSLRDPNKEFVHRETLRSLHRSDPSRATRRDEFGKNLLHTAAERVDFASLVTDIAHGCDVNAQNAEGRTPLHIAVSRCVDDRQFLNIKTLLAFGASTTAKDGQGLTPLELLEDSLDDKIKEEVKRLFKVINVKDAVVQERTTTNGEASSNPKKEALAKAPKLLALDGGGIKGLVLIQSLLALESLMTDGQLNKKFDWIAGTSTGAIVAAAFCEGMKLHNIQELYFRLKDQVFKHNLSFEPTLFDIAEEWKSLPYPTAPLEEFLKKEFGEDVTVDMLGRNEKKRNRTKADHHNGESRYGSC